MEILKIENLNFTYKKQESKAVDSVSFSIKEGEFVLLCGESGCGKTTLLKLIKPQLAPFGKLSGNIYMRGVNTKQIDERSTACDIGYVMQNPENQVVMDKVWHELSFGLENMGLPTPIIRRRVAEMANYFGIHKWFYDKTINLSGGQKQILNLASIMVMQPQILILDEPTSQLDPITAADFIGTLQKLNKELGLTILMVEHRLEEVFPVADKVGIMEKGRIQVYDTPAVVGKELKHLYKDHKILKALPSAVRIYNGLSSNAPCPLTVKEGREFLTGNYDNRISKLQREEKMEDNSGEVIIQLKNTWFRYEKESPDILCGVNMEVKKGEISCILGANGSGKTTLLNVLSGQKRAYRGTVKLYGKKMKEYKKSQLYRQNIALLPQNPQSVFLKNTIKEDYKEMLKVMEYSKEEGDEKINAIAQRLGILHLLDKHPYDLSGGEQQKAALGKILMLNPKILLLDEPTKGIDAFAKVILHDILKDLKKLGITIVIVTHDVEFAALSGDKCALFFAGEVLSADTPRTFFSGNNFYTTAANRISRHRYEGAITVEEVIELCQINERKSLVI